MATFSFTQNVIIKDSKTAERITKELKSNKGSFSHITPVPLKNETKKVCEVWFKR